MGGAEPDTIPARFAAVVAEDPDRTAIHYFGHDVSLRALDRWADAVATGLHEAGLRPGDRLAIMLQNVPEYVAAVLAAWRLGAVVVPLNPMYTARELTTVIGDCGARVLVCHPATAGAGLGHLALDLIVVTDGWTLARRREPRLSRPGPASEPYAGPARLVAFEELAATDPAGHRFQVRPGDLAILPYTSGTTGPPKGARVTHGNAFHQACLFRDWFGLGGRDALLAVSPLSHITGLIAHLGVCLVTPMPLVLAYRFHPEVMAELCAERSCTVAVGAITIFTAFLGTAAVRPESLRSLRHVVSGGAPVPRAVVEAFRERFGISIVPTYGLTETTSSSHLVPVGVEPAVDPASGAPAVGVPVTGARTRIVDPAGRVLGPGEAGEIELSGPGVVDGYWARPEESAAVIRDGWLRTGDVGFQDADGWLFVVDRLKDMIIASGFKIWPREVEDVLYEHPTVRECAVIGVPDDYRGETVAAFVSLREGARATPEELIEHCRARMAAYKYPRVIHLLDGLPKTTSGKVLRRELRALATRDTSLGET
ncbi:class I adenylate-forming enzyme family protein [Acrocarpospora catenulata]|uniref:class I adenylate-forming enzyme family protein n=1 Tax=Acrocarpospora catenulata TaxID=2836182 RepID=UPI001BD99CF5|nr:AMP-binding protein [Acrocarpospora catenulata]